MKLRFFILINFVAISLFSQEMLVPASSLVSQKAEITKSADTLTLPFFEDFSVNSNFSKHFVNNDVCISATQSIKPPSIGAAMFDAVDANFDFYTTYNQSVRADFLTSKPINLNLLASDSVYFSFYYEPQGYMDAPEANDSLVLQFFAPNQNKWIEVWNTVTDGNITFKQVNIKVEDTAFLQNGFKFRFYNVISMASSQYPSFVGNCDFWFVDYIYLNKNRTYNDLTHKDIAFQYPVKFKIGDYQQIPYSHYKNTSDLNHNLYISFRNNDNNIRSIDSMYFVFMDKKHVFGNDTFNIGSSNFQGNSDLFISRDNVNFSFPNTQESDLRYDMSIVLKTDFYDSTCNNVVHQQKSLSTLYAYDDGTAENGYGLYGEGTMYAKVAQKFYTYQTDNITGLQVYMNKTYNNEQPYYFYLVIWENDPTTGKPGEIIYEQPGLEINHSDLPGLITWQIDSPVQVTDTFYIGWKKTYTQLMNIGIDRNSTSNNYKFYNINGNWLQSSTDGVIMMRPILGDVQLSGNTEFVQAEYNIYPNPATDYINVEAPLSFYNVFYQISDLTGRIFVSDYLEADKASIDISSLKPGMYLITLKTKNSFKTYKFVKK